MIIDSSAIVAIAREESEAVTFTAAIENAADVRISAATLFEVTLVLGSDAHDYVAVSGMPLLFKGQAFVHTDVVPAVAVT